MGPESHQNRGKKRGEDKVRGRRGKKLKYRDAKEKTDGEGKDQRKQDKARKVLVKFFGARVYFLGISISAVCKSLRVVQGRSYWFHLPSLPEYRNINPPHRRVFFCTSKCEGTLWRQSRGSLWPRRRTCALAESVQGFLFV